MQTNRFFLWLSSIGIFSFLIVFVSGKYFKLSYLAQLLSYWSLSFFTVFCIVFFIWGKNLSKSKNLYRFNEVIVFSTLSKMLLSIIMLVAFKKLYQPSSKYVILPFIVIYLVYTIFETYFLTKLAKQK